MDAKISTYLIGIVMFTFFIVGGITLINILNDSKSDFIDTNKYEGFNNTVNQYGEVNEKLETLQTSITSASGGSSISDLIQVAWNTLKTIPSLFVFMGTAYVGISDVFGIPLWIPTLLGFLAVIIIVFAIWGAIFQNDL